MIFGINGKLRQGKGILATKIGLAFADSGGKVKCNYKISHPNVEEISFYQFVELLNKPRAASQTLLIIDEIYGWLDSYMSQSKANRFASYFVFQSAKLGYDIIYTSQLTMRAMNTLRELCDARVYAKKDVKNQVFKYYVLDPNEPDDDIPTGKILKLPFSEAAKFWDRYNTYEGVKPYGLKDFLTEIEKTDSGRMKKTIDRQVSTLSSLIETGAIAKDTRRIAVESALLDIDESREFSALVSFRLEQQLRQKNTSFQQQKSPSSMEIDRKQGWKALSIGLKKATA